jgi:hypothetical protein
MRCCSGLDRADELVHLGLLAVIVLGAGIRLLPVLEVGTAWLADLDPYRNLRAVNGILDSGRMPIFDPLSAAPNGTYATYSTSQGYYMLGAALTLVSGLNSVQMLSVSPVICEVALLLAVYAFGYVLTRHRGAGLVAAFFAAIVQGWAMVAIIGTCPLAENFGAVLFPLVLLLFWKYINIKKKSFLVFSGVLLGASLLIHPVTYLYLSITLFTYSILLCLLEKKIRGLVSFSGVLLISLFAVLVQLYSIKDFGSVGGFNYGALWLASLQPAYPVIDFYEVLYDVGILASFLGLLGLVLILLDKKWEDLIVVSWSAIMLIIIPLSWIVTLRSFLTSFPLGSFFFLSHRVMPYLPTALSLLSGIVVVEYLLPLTSYIGRIINLRSPSVSVKAEFALTIALILVSMPFIQSSVGYANNYKSNTLWAQQYAPLFKWIENNTKNNDVFIINDICLGEVVRTIADRPTVFTNSYQDLTTPDLEKRMWLCSSVFIEGYDDNITQGLLYDFNVTYVIVIRDQYNIDILNKRYTSPAPQDTFISYLKWMDEKNYLTNVYSDPNGQFYVYQVDQQSLFKGKIVLPTVTP